MQFVQIRPKLELKHSISLVIYCGGLAVSNGLIYAVVENKIRMLDYHGQFLRYFADNLGIPLSFGKAVYISVSDTGRLYISKWLDPGVIHCMTLDGNTMYKYQDFEPKYGACIYVDGGDNILVIGNTKDNMLVIDKTGRKAKVIFSQSDGLYCPLCLAFRDTDNSIVIGGYTEKLLVFKME